LGHGHYYIYWNVDWLYNRIIRRRCVLALETLKGLETIDDYGIRRSKETVQYPEPIIIDDTNNVISFRLQRGPIDKQGENGCQIDTGLKLFKNILEGLHEQLPCRENEVALKHLGEAIVWLDLRNIRRAKHGVEGTSEPR
jgi:hypothetical protein